MLHQVIQHHKNVWLHDPNCPVTSLIQYIQQAGELRDAQIEAIGTYLFLKIRGENKPLWILFSEGFFSNNENLSTHNISQVARDIFEANPDARALYEFSRWKSNGNGQIILPGLEKFIVDNVTSLDYEGIIKQFFYGIEYTDYLFSLPMGAGKTFLMAAFMYIDLYFAVNEPDNKIFAHNFIVVAPSGLKSSIIPSLKTIENFNPAWVLPEPAATNIKRLIKFEVLDQPKTAKKSGKVKNPNAQKINNYQPFEDLMGLVMVINAEKVILDKIDIIKVSDNFQFDFHETDDAKDKAANELRNIISKIPSLQIHIDEVHHAATDDVKLRQVVSRWSRNNTINSVLGYSGTPYLTSPDKVVLNDKLSLKFTQITNTVYYYPLTTAVKKFLKKPRVEQARGLESISIIQKGVEDFLNNYGSKFYNNGTCAKLAIYCGNIERLEEQVFPFLTGTMGIDPSLILKYHGGNSKYKITTEDKYQYLILDTPLSQKKIILLVQIGKEGWDCKSLTGVVLSQKGDCPANMVLQTSCRCLRQVVKDDKETAIIWLNEENAKVLDKQLKEEQQTSIQQLNKISNEEDDNLVQQYSRLEYLKLPPVDFYQLRVNNTTLIIEETPNTKDKIKSLSANAAFKTTASVETRDITPNGLRESEVIYQTGNEKADFYRWLQAISKGSFDALSVKALLVFEKELHDVFNTISFDAKGERYFNNLYRQQTIQSQIRLAFQQKRDIQTTEEIIPEKASLLLVEKLSAIAEHNKLYPSKEETKQILDIDASGKKVKEAEDIVNASFDEQRKKLTEQGMSAFANQLPTVQYSQAVYAKDYSFHYLPYNFKQSSFEMNFLKQAIILSEIKKLNLELYYNGERHSTDFFIKCYEKIKGYWKYVGIYTPDFLLLQRNNNAIYKAVIIETKGSGFAEQTSFTRRRKFVEGEFLQMNNKHFGYDKFDYLYLSDADKAEENLAKLTTIIKEFF